MKRGVTELITPGVALNDKILDHDSNNFLAAIHFGESKIGLALTDISTGEFYSTEGNKEQIDKMIQSFRPSEIIYARPKTELFH